MTRRRIKRPSKAELVIRPAGDGPGLYRVRFADGTLSEVLTLAEAREIARMAGLRWPKSLRSYLVSNVTVNPGAR
jgi:hypothetical protein